MSRSIAMLRAALILLFAPVTAETSNEWGRAGLQMQYFAQVWRAKAREAAARQLLVIDSHSPPKYRINGIVRNFDEWYRAFDVQPGDKLYLPPEQRIRIW